MRARQGPLHSRCILLFKRRGAKSLLANDLVTERSVVITRAACSLQFLESKPQALSICPLGARAQNSLNSSIALDSLPCANSTTTTASKKVFRYFASSQTYKGHGALKICLWTPEGPWTLVGKHWSIHWKSGCSRFVRCTMLSPNLAFCDCLTNENLLLAHGELLTIFNFRVEK